ncbi:Lovastatin diketide synthase LovF 1 [Colletotrichum plurivorum]|uniref:Lovastatin diketide synthase LovF 1 n=1 Tax=Colletotrichum plurivorum TaxID=2175906 RepID=A0A8H6NHV7_9PEZI|nr:Lovastatin diketide synthase LovF 1 [Colletotrichum plurivorum]
MDTQSSNPVSHETPQFEPIAIIGMGMRLPGRVHNAADYWDLLVNGKSGRCRVPKSRYNVDAWYGPGRIGHVPTKEGYFLEELDLARVDPSFWSFTRQEAELMDPRQRLFLEVAYEALQTAGETSFRGRDVGVYVGTMGEDWSQLDTHDEQNLNQVRPDVYGDYIIANRASYELDLTGPSIMVRTACSASLVALHMACQGLQGGDCTSALVGGVNLILNPRDTAAMQQQGVLSPTAECRTFDAGADGFARGEGISAIYIKKLSDAVRDGDTIRAVIRSTCVSGNGRTPGLTTPSPRSHEKLMRRGHEIAGIKDLSKTAMVECHGTGTVVGDPLEVSAIANIWGDHGIYIGSVKPNIGHGEGASGLSSVIKMVLALENSTIPPNINFETPNPKIPWEEAKLKVLLESAACFGGSPTKHGQDQKPPSPSQRLLVFSARHSDSVKASADAVEEYLNARPEKLNDIAYTLGVRREAHNYRSYSVIDDDNRSVQLSQIQRSVNAPKALIWVFTGQGAQYAQMGKELLEQEPLFQRRISELDDVLAALPNPPPWKLKDLLLAPKQQSRLAEAELSQPCLIAIQVALVDLLRSWGVSPTAVVGHSSGETAAGYASGAITAEDAIRIAYHRGQITRLIKTAHKGSMAAVGLGRDQIERFLKPGVIIGCENSPSNVTLSGDADVLETVMQDIRMGYPDTLVRSLRVECGYHSHHMQAAAADLTSRLEGLFQPKKPTIPFYSSVTGELLTDMSPSYWVKNVVSPVLFNTAVQSLLDDYASPTFIELGPHSALAGPTRQILKSRNRNAAYIPTLIRNEDPVSSVLKTAGELWAVGVDIDLGAVIPHGELLTDLPTYQWHYDGEYWLETRLSRCWRLREFDHHEILGTRLAQTSDLCPVWRCNLRVEDVPWLRDHVVLGETVFPAAGFVTMIGEAVRQLTASVDYTVRHVRLSSALVLTDRPVEIVTSLYPSQTMSSPGSSCYNFSISSLSHGSKVWVEHTTGECRGGAQQKQTVPEFASLPRKVSPSSFYRTWKRFGLGYGKRFRNIAEASSHVSRPEAVATLETQLSAYEKASYPMHPTMLDCSLHFGMIPACIGLERNFNQIAVPTYIEELYVGKSAEQIQLRGTTDLSNSSQKMDITGACGGQVVLEVRGLEVSVIDTPAVPGDDDPQAGGVLDWKPDVDFLDPTQVLGRRDFGACTGFLDKLVLACIVESRARLQFLPATRPHLVEFKSWLDVSYRQALTGEYSEVLTAFEVATMSSTLRQALVVDILQACQGTAAEKLALEVYHSYESCAEWFTSERGSTLIQYPANVLAESQDFLDDVDIGSFVSLLGYKRFEMRVLHVGTASEEGVKRLISMLSPPEYSHKLYSTMVFTGNAAEPNAGMKEVFDGFPAVGYRQLDIETDPTLQGLRPESFDLVLRFDTTLSQTSTAAMENMRKLLKPTGDLVLRQPNPSSKALRYIFGLHAESDAQVDNSLQQKIRETLTSAGFDGSAATTFSGEHSTLTIATPFQDNSKPNRASIVCQNPNHEVVQGATRALLSRGVDLDFFEVGQELPRGQPVLCLLDLEGPFLINMASEQWENLKRTIFSAQDEKFVWVTGASQIACSNPDYSLVLGAARSLRRELSMDLMTLELEKFDANGWAAMVSVFESLGQRSVRGEIDPDSEYAYSRGSLHVCRFHPTRVYDQLREACEDSPKSLKIANPGDLQATNWEDVENVPVQGDLVEVEVKAVGLHARVSDSSSSCLGREGSGIVRRVGPEACRVRPGDRVAFTSESSFSTSVILNEAMCARFPETMSNEEAATTPYSYGTAVHALMERGNLRKGQIFCTVETQEQQDYLISTYELTKDRVFGLHDVFLLSKIHRLTGGRGVDVVFDAVSENSLQTSWDCLAPFGSLIRVGKTDHTDSSFYLKHLNRNRTLVNLDLDELRTQKPSECTRLLEQAFLFRRLSLNESPQPITTFEASNHIEAFHFMQKRQHIGHVVVTLPENSSDISALPRKPRMNLRPDKTYVFVGGLGGLGQAIARFLAENGARNIIFFSRSAEKVADCHPEYFEELRALGCTVHAVSGSINEMTDVVNMINSTNTPIAGVLQAAMVLQTAVNPKVRGTWNLHNALQSQSEPLDFFFLFSSLSGLGGQIGQANYAAGNAFLDAFVQFRHSQGLACSVLDIGIMEDIGVLARETDRLEALRATSQHCLHEQDLLDALELMIRRSRPSSLSHDSAPHNILAGYANPSQVGIGMRSSSTKVTGWHKDPRTGFMKGATSPDVVDLDPNSTTDGGQQQSLRDFLRACGSSPEQLASDDAKAYLAREIAGALRGFTMREDEEDVDLSVPLQTDSLVTVELRNWLRRTMGVSFTVMELRAAESIFALGEAAAAKLSAVE